MNADPTGIHAMTNYERRRLKVHAPACGPAGKGWSPVCGASPFYLIALADSDAVTCRVCLYWMGLYVPLAKLREHQAAQRMRAEAWAPGRPWTAMTS